MASLTSLCIFSLKFSFLAFLTWHCLKYCIKVYNVFMHFYFTLLFTQREQNYVCVVLISL